MFKKLLLTKQQNKKIALLEKLAYLPKNSYNTQTLCSQLGYSYQTLQALLIEINSELAELNEESIRLDNSQLTISHDLARLNKYKKYQIKQSIPYQFLLYTLFFPQKKLDQFSKEVFASKSTIVRRLQPLLAYAEQFQIKIHVSNMEIQGEESIVRIFYIIFLWLGSLGQEFPSEMDFFEEKQLVADADIKEIHQVHPSFFLVTLIVTRIRLDQKHFLAETPFSGLIFSPVEKEVELYVSQFIINPEQVARNTEFINYMIHYYPYSIDVQQYRFSAADVYYQKQLRKGEPLFLVIQDFYNYCLAFLPKDLSQRDNSILLRNIMITFLNYSIQKNQLPLAYELMQEDSLRDDLYYMSIAKKINSFLKKISRRKDFLWMKPILAEFTHSLTLVILLSYENVLFKQKITVNVIPCLNFQQTQYLCNVLETITFLDIKVAYEDSSEIDFYITSDSDLLPTTTKPYFLVNFDNPCFESELFSFLVNLKKNIA